ncbi:MAG: response regulator [Planctomycetes bacterium]|nr:response regulator [Planctomycetota bacterium]
MSGKSDGGSQSEQPFNDGEREPNKLRILLVDDSKGLRFVISNFLSRCGYEVVEAEDGEDGLEKLDAMGPFDLIITDMEMPKMGGQKLIETVALRKNSPKMILQSGNYEGEEIAKKLDVPFYLKGEDMDLLLQTIKKLMDSSPKKYTEDGTTPQASIREDTLSSGGSAVEKKLRILLVEDTESMRYIISCDLSESGFEVVEAENGKVALDKLETMEPFDLVITDNRMPWMNGLELIEILSSWKSPPKIILMSAGSSDKDIARRLAIPYFDKETSLEKFMQMIIDLTNPGETNIENGGNWVWLYELLKYTFFPKLTQKEYNDKWALLEDVISYIGMGLLAYHLALLLPGSNSVVAELVAYFHGIFITMLGHRKLISHFFVSRAPPLHLKTAETISWISFFAGVLGIIFPALMPIIFTVPFITHWIINNRSDSNSLAESASTEETMGIIQKHTEPTLLYQLAYHGAKTFLSMSRILDKEPVVVVQLDRFVKIKGEDIHVPKAFETVLQGIVDAVKEEKGTIAFVSESNRREEIIKTLLSKVEHREAASKLQYFFAEDSEKMKDTIRRKNLSISFVLTLFPDQWKGYTRLTLGKLLAGLINGFEMRVEGEFREALEAMIQESGWMENGSIIHRDGQLILQQKYLKPELAEHLWKEQVYRLSA